MQGLMNKNNKCKCEVNANWFCNVSSPVVSDIYRDRWKNSWGTPVENRGVFRLRLNLSRLLFLKYTCSATLLTNRTVSIFTHFNTLASQKTDYANRNCETDNSPYVFVHSFDMIITPFMSSSVFNSTCHKLICYIKYTLCARVAFYFALVSSVKAIHLVIWAGHSLYS